eukprot:m.1683506 g.1683506  ORF g.1683506 m.1683506 type:complete len:55 (-) comp238259_c0_seq1:76-240(-)
MHVLRKKIGMAHFVMEDTVERAYAPWHQRVLRKQAGTQRCRSQTSTVDLATQLQ